MFYILVITLPFDMSPLHLLSENQSYGYFSHSELFTPSCGLPTILDKSEKENENPLYNVIQMQTTKK